MASQTELIAYEEALAGDQHSPKTAMNLPIDAIASFSNTETGEVRLNMATLVSPQEPSPNRPKRPLVSLVRRVRTSPPLQRVRRIFGIRRYTAFWTETLVIWVIALLLVAGVIAFFFYMHPDTLETIIGEMITESEIEAETDADPNLSVFELIEPL